MINRNIRENAFDFWHKRNNLPELWGQHLECISLIYQGKPQNLSWRYNWIYAYPNQSQSNFLPTRQISHWLVDSKDHNSQSTACGYHVSFITKWHHYKLRAKDKMKRYHKDATKVYYKSTRGRSPQRNFNVTAFTFSKVFISWYTFCFSRFDDLFEN